MTIIEQSHRERTLLVALEDPRRQCQDSLEELTRLVETAGGEVVGTVTQKLDKPDPTYYVGKGKAHEIRGLAAELRADLVLIDDEITPRQEHNLEDATGAGVLGRSAIILDIFALRAHSREGKLQVELAQLNYLLPRLTGKGTALSRLGGGIGTRGPGETKLESDRRKIRKRLGLLRKQVEKIAERRTQERRQRQKAGIPTVALVGYTNAGKSTLLNTLSGADVFVEDRLFATLDPTIRRVELPGGRDALLIDTVGFIRNLPHLLVAAFHATLEEVVEADALIHVVDASHPQMEEQIVSVQRVLGELGGADKPTIVAFNKADLVAGDGNVLPADHWLHARMAREKHAAVISALTRTGLEELLRLVGERLEQSLVPVDLMIPWSDSRLQREAQNLVSEAHQRGRVLSEKFGPEGITLIARVPEDVAQKLRKVAGQKDE